MTPSSKRATSFKHQLFHALEKPQESSGAARVVGIALIVLICVNALLIFIPQSLMIETWTSEAVRWLANASAIVFFAEYCARIWVADMARPHLPRLRARLRYVVSPMGIVDLLAFLPAAVAWFVPLPSGLLGIVTILRLVRLIKITRYMRGMHTIMRVMKRRRHEIVASFMVLGLLAVVASVLMYEVEHAAQPEAFDSTLTGLYWAITTMSSTGYGDLTPITPLGRIIGWVLMVLSIAVVAIPGGIFSAGFVEEFRNPDKDNPDNDNEAPEA